MGEILAFASALAALVAVVVAVWQTKRSTRLGEDALVLPVLAECFGEFRSEEFRGHINVLLSAPEPDPEHPQPFEGLGELQESAYQVCYYFEYLGVLTAHGMVRVDVVVGTMATQLVAVWNKMFPWIEAERASRSRGSIPLRDRVASGFLPHYENLVREIESRGGPDAGAKVREALPGWRVPRSPHASSRPQAPPPG
ncbi:DUF4760 domain-containing protein [Streptomyces sp. BH097]|uniref:DUF4760 domain-containing protein n=1 Tax=unclassified Streptomyces TaxID=2593676 RepID=UPI003BB4A39B